VQRKGSGRNPFNQLRKNQSQQLNKEENIMTDTATLETVINEVHQQSANRKTKTKEDEQKQEDRNTINQTC
jgi:hypothetical protein